MTSLPVGGIYGLALLAYLFTVATILTYKAIVSKDLLKAILYSAGQSVAFAIALTVLMAPDVLYAYLAVSVGIYPIILLYAVRRTQRYEGGGGGGG